MSSDFNNIKYPYMEETPKNDEAHKEGGYAKTVLSNAQNEYHPFFSPQGMKELINSSRNMANSSKEKELSGDIKEDVIKGIAAAARKTKLPMDILIFAMDWEKDMTSRSDGSGAEDIAKKLLNSVPQLRSSLGRDPMVSEIFAGFVLGSASKVKELFEKAESKPDEEAQSVGSSKDDILMNKNRNGKDAKRTNREVYDFFRRRMSNGNVTFKEYVTEKPYSEETK